MKASFTDKGLSEYMEWLEVDRKKLKKINELIKSIKKDGLLGGIGRPEKLKWIEGMCRLKSTFVPFLNQNMPLIGHAACA